MENYLKWHGYLVSLACGVSYESGEVRSKSRQVRLTQISMASFLILSPSFITKRNSIRQISNGCLKYDYRIFSEHCRSVCLCRSMNRYVDSVSIKPISQVILRMHILDRYHRSSISSLSKDHKPFFKAYGILQAFLDRFLSIYYLIIPLYEGYVQVDYMYTCVYMQVRNRVCGHAGGFRSQIRRG